MQNLFYILYYKKTATVPLSRKFTIECKLLKGDTLMSANLF